MAAHGRARAKAQQRRYDKSRMRGMVPCKCQVCMTCQADFVTEAACVCIIMEAVIETIVLLACVYLYTVCMMACRCSERSTDCPGMKLQQNLHDLNAAACAPILSVAVRASSHKAWCFKRIYAGRVFAVWQSDWLSPPACSCMHVQGLSSAAEAVSSCHR